MAAKKKTAKKEIVFTMPERYVITEQEREELETVVGTITPTSADSIKRMSFNMVLSGVLEGNPYSFGFETVPGSDIRVIFGDDPIGKIVFEDKKKRDPRTGKFFIESPSVVYKQSEEVNFAPHESPMGPWKLMSSVCSYFVGLILSGKWASNNGIMIADEDDEPTVGGTKLRRLAAKSSGRRFKKRR